MITPARCIEARALLKWSRDRLAPRCEMSVDKLRHFELGWRDLPPEDMAALRETLEAAGVEFTNGGEPGVKLRKQAAR